MRYELDPLSDVLQRLSAAGFDGVEFAYRLLEGGADPAAVATTLSGTGLDVVGGNVLQRHLDEELETVTAIYDQVRCDRIIARHFEDRFYEDESSVTDLAEYIGRQHDNLTERGFDFAVHYDGRTLGGGEESAFDVLAAELDGDVAFELDVRHAVAAGRDPVALIERYGEQTSTVHISDWAPGVGRSIRLGAGRVDVDECLDAARAAGLDWVVYEGDHTIDTLEGALDRLRTTSITE